jgi:hypothetical protein
MTSHEPKFTPIAAREFRLHVKGLNKDRRKPANIEESQ